MLKKLLMILIIVGSLFLVGCATKVEPIKIEPVKFEQTQLPDDSLINKIAEIKKKIGTSPKSIIIKQNGITYVAFTNKEFKKIAAKNELTKYLEETIKLVHERQKIYVMEINQLKRLNELQNMESNVLQNMYVKAETRANEERSHRTTEGVLYKLLFVLQTVAIILLI